MSAAENAGKVEMYRQAVMMAATCAQMLSQYDYAQLLRDISLAESTGPVFDPTLWRSKAQAMEEDKKLIEAAIALAKFARPVRLAGGE